MSDQSSAYAVLQALAQRSLANAHPLPAQLDTVLQWNGIGFSLLGLDFVISMDELDEMLEIPSYTRLPGVRSWVKGVANVRGRLLPLFDMAAFYSGSLSGSKKYQRLLVLDNDLLYAGLWVERVYGMQHFVANTKVDGKVSGLPDHLEKIVDGYYELDDRRWLVFSAQALCEDTNFINVATA